MQILIMPTILAIVIVCPIFWFVSEFKAKRPIRLIFGVLSLLSALLVAFVIGHLEQFNYNVWYGQATSELLEVSITGLHQGQSEVVLEKWKALNQEFQPTYRNKAAKKPLLQFLDLRCRNPLTLRCLQGFGYVWLGIVVRSSSFRYPRIPPRF